MLSSAADSAPGTANQPRDSPLFARSGDEPLALDERRNQRIYGRALLPKDLLSAHPTYIRGRFVLLFVGVDLGEKSMNVFEIVSFASLWVLDTTLFHIVGHIRDACISRGQHTRVVDRYQLRIAQIVAPFGMTVRILDEWVKATIPAIAIISHGNRDLLNTASDHMTDESMPDFMIGVVHTSLLIVLCGRHFHLAAENSKGCWTRFFARQQDSASTVNWKLPRWPLPSPGVPGSTKWSTWVSSQKRAAVRTCCQARFHR
jgi:hypothetical protein